MKNRSFLVPLIFLAILVLPGCKTTPEITPITLPDRTNTIEPTDPEPEIVFTPTSLVIDNSDEPSFIIGKIPFSSPFFVNILGEPFVMLEDQTGFINRDKDFVFELKSQIIGPVEMIDEKTLSYHLSLPRIPSGNLNDIDNDSNEDEGVQIFQVAFWGNTWGDPFLEERDGTGWSNIYTSAITDPENDNEIVGGFLIVWAPNGDQKFPTTFGPDGLIFTNDDPVQAIPAGYSIVDLNQEPFKVFKEREPEIDLLEGIISLNDYSDLDYRSAFEKMFEKVSVEYAFTSEKAVDWDQLYKTFSPRITSAKTSEDFYQVLKDMFDQIPDSHIGLNLNSNVFFANYGGGYGLVLDQLSSGEVIVKYLIPDSPAEKNGIKIGAEILEWNRIPILDALESITPHFGPYSTDHNRRLGQLLFLPRGRFDDEVEITVNYSEQSRPTTFTMKAIMEIDSLLMGYAPISKYDPLSPPIEGESFQDIDVGYIKISTFSDDYSLLAKLWTHYMESLNESDIRGLIIDIRNNPGGSGGLALDFASYFFEDTVELFWGSYYNSILEDFELSDHPSEITPGPLHFDGPVILLIGPECISACESFAYAMSQSNKVTIIGHYPTAGAFGEVGRGQYELPGDISLQIPTGKFVDQNGNLVIEGVGVHPDIVVPVTRDSVLSTSDTLFDTAITHMMEILGN